MKRWKEEKEGGRKLNEFSGLRALSRVAIGHQARVLYDVQNRCSISSETLEDKVHSRLPFLAASAAVLVNK